MRTTRNRALKRSAELIQRTGGLNDGGTSRTQVPVRHIRVDHVHDDRNWRADREQLRAVLPAATLRDVEHDDPNAKLAQKTESELHRFNDHRQEPRSA